MTKFKCNLTLEDATDIQFTNLAGANTGKIESDGDNLVLSNAVGDILIGDGASDVYIGDGSNSVDILFEVSGSLSGESGAALTLGGAGGTLALGSSILSALTVGVDDTGHDVTFYGATSGKKMLWDESADTLVVDGTLDINGDASILTGGGSGTLTVGRNGNENMVFYVDDANTTITGVQDSDANGAHSFILNRTFLGSGANNFIIQKGGTAQLTLDTNGAATFAGRVIIGDDAITTDKPGLVVGDTTNNGQITIRGGQPTLFFDKSGSNDSVILTDSVNLKFKNGTLDSEGSDQLTLDTNGNATFAGTIGSGAITSTGQITGTELEGTSLDINGDADISGNITTATWAGAIIPEAKLENQSGTNTGDTSITDSTSTTSNTTRASATAVKAAYDRGSTGVTNAATAQTTANAALPKAGGTMSGAIAMGSQNITGGGTITGTTITGTKLIGTPADANTHSLTLGRTDNSNYWHVNHAGDDFRLYNTASSGSHILFGVDSGGTVKANNVGVGTATPGEKLDVVGNIAVSGTVDGIDIATDVAANTLKATNVAGNLGVTANGTSLTVTTTNGSNIALPAATTSAWGVMTDEMFDAIAANTVKGALVVDAEEGTRGMVELASEEEATAGSNDDKAVTPAGLTAGASAVVLSKKIHELAAPTAALSMNSQKITGVTDPTAAQDAATKAYTDAKTWNWNDITAGTAPTFNQNTTGSAATLTTPRAINGVDFNGSAAITIPTKAYFEFKGYGTSDGTDYEMSQEMGDSQAPFEHDTSTGSDGLTAQTIQTLFRIAGTVMPRSGTIESFFGWNTSAGGGTVDIGLFKITPTDDTAGNLTPVLLVNKQTTASGNATPNSFSESGLSVAFAAGDIIYSAVKGGTASKTWYFTSTLEVQFS